MDIQLVPAAGEDRRAMTAIFNHYVDNSYAAFPEERVSETFVAAFTGEQPGYPVFTVREGDQVAGFGMLRPYHPYPVFARTAEVTYFLAPGFTRRGIGGALLERLVAEARKEGITSLLARVSSLNDASLRFHQRNGFQECGRFRGIGRKWGRDFDVVWFQRMI